MSDIFEMIQFGEKITCHGEDWIRLKPLQNRCSLVIKFCDMPPCPVFLIQEPSPTPKGKGEKDNE